MDTSENYACRVLMLPWLAHGHISPFFELARKLVERNFQVCICSTPSNLNPIREDLDVENSNLSSSIQFIELHLPSSSGLSPESQTTKNLPPDLLPTLLNAFDEAKDSFFDILQEIKPDILIYDWLQHWAPVMAQEESIPAVLFVTSGPPFNAFLLHCIRNPDSDYPILGALEGSFPKRAKTKIKRSGEERLLQCFQGSSEFILIKNLNWAEEKHADYLSTLISKDVISVGPLVGNPEGKSCDMLFVNWLNQRDPFSAVFVAFGGEYFLSGEDIRAIAYGLELSTVSFIWAIRLLETANFSSLSEILPEGFQERVAERGLVVEGWAPQAKILTHPSIGGFVSHCGWSSTLESIAFGVPIIAMPMQHDQPFNASWAVEIGVAIEVRKVNGKYDEMEIARAIKQVVLQEEGEKVRKKVRKYSSKINEKGDHQEIDRVVNKLVGLL